jgi:hypothetical protein
LSDFNEMQVLWIDFLKNIQISNFMKIRLVGAEFHAAERTDMMKLIVAFRGFGNVPKTT